MGTDADHQPVPADAALKSVLRQVVTRKPQASCSARTLLERLLSDHPVWNPHDGCGSVAYFRWPEELTFESSSTGSFAGRIYERLQAAAIHLLVPTVLSRRDDPHVAKTPNSLVSRHRQHPVHHWNAPRHDEWSIWLKQASQTNRTPVSPSSTGEGPCPLRCAIDGLVSFSARVLERASTAEAFLPKVIAAKVASGI